MLSHFNPDESGRLHALKRLDILDTLEEQPFEDIISLVQNTLHVPICAVSLIDKERQWFKARRGLDVSHTCRKVAFCGHAIQNTHPFIVEDATQDARFCDNPLVTGEPNIRSYCGIPLTMPDGYNIGTLCIIDRVPRHFTPAEIDTLKTFARLVIEKIDLRQVAARDGLTGALTRAAWNARAQAALQASHRVNSDLSLMVFDIDHFKSVNDTFGHAAGDAALEQIAQIVFAIKRTRHLFGRFGGEEFTLLMPDTNIHEATVFANRLRSEINSMTFMVPQDVHLSISIGITSKLTEDDTLDDLMQYADCALYQAKRAGRDRVSVADRLDAPEEEHATGHIAKRASVA